MVIEYLVWGSYVLGDVDLVDMFFGFVFVIVVYVSGVVSFFGVVFLFVVGVIVGVVRFDVEVVERI